MTSVSMLRQLVLVAVVAATSLTSTLFVPLVHASPSPPPNLPIRIDFYTVPSRTHIKDHKVRMKVSYNDAVIYDQTVEYRGEFTAHKTPANYRPGGNLKFELSLIDSAGREVKKDTKTRANGFGGTSLWAAGEVSSPDNKVSHAWTVVYNAEVKGYLSLTFSVENRFY